MARSNAAQGRPKLTREDGSRLPRHLSLAHAALLAAPPAAHRQLARVAWKAFGYRLPAILASYPDGRRFRVPAGDVMYAQVFIHGAYEPSESAVLTGLLRRGDFAIDVGANHGWYSLLMASAVGAEGTVWAVEPVPPMLAELRANLERNPGAPVEVKPAALGEERGTVKINVFAGLVHGHASISTLGRDDYVEHEAPSERLDAMLEVADRAPALVKLDVEGAERSVLRGAGDLLDGPEPPVWMIEVNAQTSRAFGYEPAALVDELLGHGHHSVYRTEAGALVADRDPGGAPHGSTWICVPENRRERVEGLVR